MVCQDGAESKSLPGSLLHLHGRERGREGRDGDKGQELRHLSAPQPHCRLGSVQLSTEVTPSGGMRDTAFPVSSKGHTYQGTLRYASYSVLKSTVW